MSLARVRWTRLALAAALLIPLAIAVPPASVPAEAKSRFIDLKKVPKPNVTGAEIIEGLEEFVDEFSPRINGTDQNIAAAQFLRDEAKKYGFKTKIRTFELDSTPPRTVRVVEAIKRGTKKPNDWITFIAHYDTVAGGGATIQGAYDDGSGTNMLRYFGKAFSKQKTKKSIVLLWFDAEENGLLASRAYADRMEKRKQKISAGLGFDMVGIAYPARYCLCIYHGPVDGPLAEPIIDHVNFKFLKWPEGDGAPGATQRWPIGAEPHVCSCGQNIRNSDEQSFSAKGYFTMRWTGMRTAADYPGYHQPWDTVPFMELVAGGRDILEEGTMNTFLSAWYTAWVIDNLP